VVGVLGELVAIPVVLGLRQEHAQTLHRLMEDPSVPEAQVKVVTHNHVQWKVFGVLGDLVANLVDLEYRQEHA